MLAIRKALILSTILQASSFAWSDPTLPQNARKTEPQKAAVATTPRIDYFDLHLPSEREMEGQPPPIIDRGTLGSKPAQNALNLAPTQGLHLSQIDQHPALEYHLSDKNTVRFHIGAHGGVASSSWGF